MNILLVHAHPEHRSFCTALRDTAAEVLAARGHTVLHSDLYAMGFNPVASAADFGERKSPDYLTYALEQRHGVESGTLAPDIRAEIDKVKSADLLILTFPLFWMSVPAMMKGWIDRVFASGVFYGGKRVYGKGGMAGKKALVALTLGGRDHMFGPGAFHGPLVGEGGMLRHLLQGSLGYVGMEVLEPFIGWHIPYLSDEERKAILADWRQQLEQIESRPTLAMPDLARFDDTYRPVPV